jgi:hypothetical protein
MTKPNVFDPPMPMHEVSRIYDLTTWLLERLGMPMWRIQFLERPCDRDSYATIKPVDGKHIGELAVHPEWMTLDLDENRVVTLVHEMLHLTHRILTDVVNEDIRPNVGAIPWFTIEARWNRAIELWTDHMTQVLLGLLKPELEAKVAEIWGDGRENDGDQG